MATTTNEIVFFFSIYESWMKNGMKDEWLNICLLIFVWPSLFNIHGSVTRCG